jgi:antitoxin component YwqK of YwqJK toxin-antitoxin module
MEMKNTLIIPILLLIFSCSTPKAVLNTNGIEEIGTLIDLLKEGRWKTYENGKLISVGNYHNNQQTGNWKYFHPNGKIHRIGKFISDKQNGIWNYYFDNGNLLGNGELINQELHGLWRYYYKNGNLYTERFYDHGKLLDIRSCYDKNGGQIDCGRIIDGNGTLILHDVEINTDTV